MKIFLLSRFITAKNLVTISHTVRVHVGGLKNWTDAGPAYWVGDVDDPLKRVPTCVKVS